MLRFASYQNQRDRSPVVTLFSCRCIIDIDALHVFPPEWWLCDDIADKVYYCHLTIWIFMLVERVFMGLTGFVISFLGWITFHWGRSRNGEGPSGWIWPSSLFLHVVMNGSSWIYDFQDMFWSNVICLTWFDSNFFLKKNPQNSSCPLN